MNYVFVPLLVISLVWGVCTGRVSAVAEALTEGAAEAVTLALSLLGAYMFFMGLMAVMEESGIGKKAAKWTAPLFSRLFPRAKGAQQAITMNLTANFFGLGSAATPYGLTAMRQMRRDDGAASDEMCLFLALNAASIELLPTGVVALRASLGAASPYAVVLPTFFASLCASAAAVLFCRFVAPHIP